MRELATLALKTVLDPDVGINIVDLGLVETLTILPDHVEVGLIMTSPACPQGDYLVDECLAALRRSFGPDVTLSVDILDAPEWTPARLSDAARQQLGWPS
ncbi:MAG TPA: metal-sulfur cluster assembly factor [Patescibacteria group bacterium]|nr:metal-sulfur cluster assembly factor [Patescibacteria group bacterium]